MTVSAFQAGERLIDVDRMLLGDEQQVHVVAHSAGWDEAAACGVEFVHRANPVGDVVVQRVPLHVGPVVGPSQQDFRDERDPGRGVCSR